MAFKKVILVRGNIEILLYKYCLEQISQFSQLLPTQLNVNSVNYMYVYHGYYIYSILWLMLQTNKFMNQDKCFYAFVVRKLFWNKVCATIVTPCNFVL